MSFREFEAKAIEAYSKLTSNFPATPRHRERFLMVLGDVGDLALAQKRYDDAIDQFELATLQGEMLVAYSQILRFIKRDCRSASESWPRC